MKKIHVPKRLPLQSHPDHVIREYYRNLNRYAEKYIQLMKHALREVIPELKEVAANELPIVRQSTVPIRLDSIRLDTNIEKRIADLFDWVDRELNSAFTDFTIRSWSKAMVHNTNKHVKQGTAKTFDKLDMNVEPLLHDRELNPFFNNIIDENVGLIKSIPTEKSTAFKNDLVNGISKDMTVGQIADIIKKHLGKDGNVKARARFIARDQVGKLNGALNKYRQQQLGGEYYFWEGSMDEREREDHKKLQGKRFSWDNPPITNRASGARNHPGEDFQCRCRARMDVGHALGIEDFHGKGESAASIRQRAAQSKRVLGK